MARAADRPRTTPGSRRIPRRAGAGYRDGPEPDTATGRSRIPRRARLVQAGFTGGARGTGGPADGRGSPGWLCGHVRARSGQVGGLLHRCPGARGRRQQPDGGLLSSAGGANLILRAMGRAAPHPLGSVGIQYVVWTAAGEEDLARGERALTARGAHRETRHDGSPTLVEGRDPDDVPVMISYPGTDRRPTRKLPARIYGW